MYAIKDSLSDYAKDIKLNLSNLMSNGAQDGLSEKQVWGIALAVAYSTKRENIVVAVEKNVEQFLTATEIEAIKGAATIMAMNNVYYRFIHEVSDKTFATLPAKLRMNIIANPGMDKVDFELCSLAVSAINGCGLCMDSHTKTLLKHNVSYEGIQLSIRIAAIINALSQTLSINDNTTIRSA